LCCSSIASKTLLKKIRHRHPILPQLRGENDPVTPEMSVCMVA
jgi:hypothetical protein